MRAVGAERLARSEGRARTYAASATVAGLGFRTTGVRAEDLKVLGGTWPDNVLNLVSSEAGSAGLAILLLVCAVTAVAVLHLVSRRIWVERVRILEGEVAQANAEKDRALTMLRGDPQIMISWDRPESDPTIMGNIDLVREITRDPHALTYDSWLGPYAAAQVHEATERLLIRGETFSFSLVAQHGRHLEIEGRPVSGTAVVRIRDISGERLELARLKETLSETASALSALRLALQSAGLPAWARDVAGRVVWCNAAYAHCVDAPDEKFVVGNQVELLERPARREAAEAIKDNGLWTGRASSVVDGERRSFEAAEIRTVSGSVGIAQDVSEIAALRAEMERNEEEYSRMMDRLSTAVVMFDKSKRLSFYNTAYRQMWSLDEAFLDQHPADGEILDCLRAKRQLPEQVNFREWKAQQMSAYQAIEPNERVWHLPDGRTLRVVTSPNPKGGVTYLYDDATQSYALASQVSALTHVQGETLDALKEGVVVFGGDGRMKLFNPVFCEVWRVDPAKLGEHPHIDEISDACRALCRNPGLWDELRAMVVGLSERRESRSVRIARTDSMTFDCAALPLPDGATLLTSLDVTASANVERALTERNQALVEAEKLRNDFVNHVSYELRTPLTNIIGFTQLLAAGGVGPLNPKQLEYAGFITNSSHALLAIIDEILDLASIDAGALELRLETVDVADAMKAAATGVHDRLDEASIEMRIVMTDGVGTLRADGRRVRQVLFNLLSNAINYSEAGQTVTLAAMRRGSEVVFKVSDRGRGIPPEMIDRVFDRFETLPNGSRHRGPGLGLSIVKALVELHKGRVLIDTAPNEGTTVTCIFPIDPTTISEPADDLAERTPRPFLSAGRK